MSQQAWQVQPQPFPGPTGGATRCLLPLAPMRRRAVAWLIDAALGLLLAATLTKALGGAADLSALWHLVFFKSVQGQTGQALTRALDPRTAGLAALRPIAGLLAIVAAITVTTVTYRVVTVALWGAGLGKLLLDLRVAVDRAGPPDSPLSWQTPGWGRSWRRWLVPQAPGLIPLPATGLLAYLPAFRDARRRGLHDRAAGTVVIALGAPATAGS